MRIIKIVYFLFITLVGLLLLNQSSISIYWQQTYHQDFLQLTEQDNRFYSFFEQTNQKLLDNEDHYFSIFNQWNDSTLEQLNLTFFNSTQAKKQISKNINNSKIEESEESEEGTKIKEITPIKELSHKNNTQYIQPIVIKSSDKILFIGDSMMQGVAPRVKKAFYKKYHIESLDLSKQSTGLTYPHFFDWPKTVETALEKDSSIKVIVAFMGPNDPWNLSLDRKKSFLIFKSKEWEQIYRERIERILSAAKNNQVQVIWLSAPCMRKKSLNSGMQYLNSLYQSEVSKSNAHFIQTSELLGCKNESYMNSILTQKGNAKVRLDDGIHFTFLGQRILANRIIKEINVQQNNPQGISK